MSRTGSTTNLPPPHTATSEVAASLEGEHLSEYTADNCPTPRTNVSEVEDGTDADSDVLWLGWDGPDDPMNPKK